MKNTFQAVTLVALLWGGHSGVAVAQASTIDTDVRCLVISGELASSATDPKIKSVAMMAALYYLGRVDAQPASRDDLKQRFTAVAAMPQTDKQAQLARCGQTMQASGKRMTDIGDEMKAGALPKPAG